MKRTFKLAFKDTIPILTGYLALGFGAGILLNSVGYGVFWAFIMSLTMYSGSMQFIAAGLLSGGASLITTAITTLMVNARHLFYGISMLEKYKNVGKRKLYLMFSLTDETYSLLCNEPPHIPPSERRNYYLFVSALNHSYWIMGCVLGSLTGTLVKFNSEGIDFVLTALFITIFVEQWLCNKKHTSAIIGVVASVLCFIIFGGENFLIAAMLIIAIALCIYKEVPDYE